MYGSAGIMARQIKRFTDNQWFMCIVSSIVVCVNNGLWVSERQVLCTIIFNHSIVYRKVLYISGWKGKNKINAELSLVSQCLLNWWIILVFWKQLDTNNPTPSSLKKGKIERKKIKNNKKFRSAFSVNKFRLHDG